MLNAHTAPAAFALHRVFHILFLISLSGLAKAFPDGRVTHPEDQIEEEKEEKLNKYGRK